MLCNCLVRQHQKPMATNYMSFYPAVPSPASPTPTGATSLAPVNSCGRLQKNGKWPHGGNTLRPRKPEAPRKCCTERRKEPGAEGRRVQHEREEPVEELTGQSLSVFN